MSQRTSARSRDLELQAQSSGEWKISPLTATSMRSRATSSMLRITFFSILTSCDSLRAKSGPKAPAAFLRKAWPKSAKLLATPLHYPQSTLLRSDCRPRRDLGVRLGKTWPRSGSFSFTPRPPITPTDRAIAIGILPCFWVFSLHSPRPPFPSQRLDLVEDNGGAGLSTCEAVGARVWRIE